MATIKQIKQRNHNEWFRPLSKTTCPSCGVRHPVDGVWSWGEYVHGKWNTVSHFCLGCYETKVKARLIAHTGACGCAVTLVGKGAPLPAWLTIKSPQYCVGGFAKLFSLDEAKAKASEVFASTGVIVSVEESGCALVGVA